MRVLKILLKWQVELKASSISSTLYKAGKKSNIKQNNLT